MLLSANINGRGGVTPTRQLDAVLEQHPDVIPLQEMTAGVYADWCRGLTKTGYSVVSTVDLVGASIPAAGGFCAESRPNPPKVRPCIQRRIGRQRRGSSVWPECRNRVMSTL